MFISEKLCYLEMHKTGSQHIAKLLSKYVKNGKRIGNHNRPSSEIYLSKRIFLGSIRNPWEWYASLWSFGCIRRGFLYGRLTDKKIYYNSIGLKTKPILSPYIFFQQFFKPLKKWRFLYSDEKNVNNFRTWLKLLLNNKRKYDSGDGFGLSSLNKFTGLMTYRYLVLYSKNIKEIYKDSLINFEKLKDFDDKNNILNYTLRNESLERDFIDFIKMLKIDINENDEAMILSLEKTNTSLRKKSISDLFDDECLNLIEERERLLIEKYSYKKPNM